MKPILAAALAFAVAFPSGAIGAGILLRSESTLGGQKKAELERQIVTQEIAQNLLRISMLKLDLANQYERQEKQGACPTYSEAVAFSDAAEAYIRQVAAAPVRPFQVRTSAQGGVSRTCYHR